MSKEQLSGWAEIENSYALHALAAEEDGQGISTNGYFYALVFDSHILSDHKLFKIGITKNIVQRLSGHKTSFPGWRLVALLEVEFPQMLENWWKEFLRPWQYKASPEVFYLPDVEFDFFHMTISWVSMWQGAALVEPEYIRQFGRERRILLMAEASGLMLKNE